MKLDWKRSAAGSYTWRGTVPQWAWHYSIEREMTYSIYTVRLHLSNGHIQEVGSRYTLPEAKRMAKEYAERRHQYGNQPD
jgi:hypothetical protein